METFNLARMANGLLEKRGTIENWLRTTPPWKRRIQLGPSPEVDVEARLHVLDEVIERTDQGEIGQCEVCGGEIQTRLLEMDYTCCICLEHFSPDERRRLEEELELSQTIQRALLPQQMPAIPGIDIAAFSRPAEIVGGDYFDFARFQDGTESLVIADVAGHGMASSMLMASVQTAFRTLTPASHSPAEVLERLNHYFTHNINFTTYVTMYLGRFDPKNGRLSYANAGHNPPLVYHKRRLGGSSVDWLKPTAPSIGLVEGFQATEITIQMESGDVLLLYTDGIIESMSPQGQEFGQERLETFLLGEKHLPAQEIVQALLRNLRSFTGGAPFADDVTIVAWKVD